MAASSNSSLFADLQALLALQAIDTRLDRARAALSALDNGSAAAARFNARKAEADAARAAANHAMAEQKDAELKLASIEAKTKDVNKSLYGGKITASRELANLEKELAMLGRQRDDTESAVLEAMEAAASANAAAATTDAALETATGEYRRIRSTFKSRSAQLTEEITTAEKERTAAVRPIPASLVARYDAIRPKRGGIGATLLDEDQATCGGCHIRLNTTLTQDLQLAASVQVCEHCGRILIPIEALD